jgi:hypothetical protein
MSDRDRNWRRERERAHEKKRDKRSTKVPRRVRDTHEDSRWERFDLPHEDHDLDD